MLLKTHHPYLKSKLKPTAVMLICGLLGACATEPGWINENSTPNIAQKQPKNTDTITLPGGEEPLNPNKNRFYQTPKAPTRNINTSVSKPAYQEPAEPGKEAAVAFSGMPLGQFIESVFGVVLKKTIQIDPQVQARTDLVSMRSGKPLNPTQLYQAAKTVLEAYGVTIQELPGLTRFVSANSDTSSLPEIRRGRAMPEVPESVRPIFYLAELENTHITNAATWIKSAFKDKVTITEDNTRNALMISGTPANVSAAMQALMVLDQPLMRGRHSVRINPTFWSVEELSKKLTDILTAQGYYTSTSPSQSAPVIMVPVGAVNSLIVFAYNKELTELILKWVEELDQPSQARSGNYFIYPVRNADANDIATTINQVFSGGGTASKDAAAAKPAGKIVVDKASNSLIIQATAAEYQQWYSLIQELDRPAKTALISVSVAEIRLQNGEELGFEWIVRNLKIGNLTGIGSIGNVTVGGKNLINFGRDIDPLVIMNALARSSKANVLSNPSILTRSGEDATIQVGQEVPVITSQQSNAETGSATGGILQTIQYRTTGVILKVRPVVRTGGRIDLTVDQEVSSAEEIVAGGIKSPSFSTRKLSTKLTVRDGNTVVLGGLMSDMRNDADSGVPYAKDIPGIGSLFKNSTSKGDRTELIMLITAYAIEDDFDAQSISEAFKSRFPWTVPLYRETPIPEQGTKSLQDKIEASPTGKPYVRSNATEGSAANQEGNRTASPTNAVETPTDMTFSKPEAPSATKPAAAPPPRPDPNRPTVKIGNGETGMIVNDAALQKELMEALKGLK